MYVNIFSAHLAGNVRLFIFNPLKNQNQNQRYECLMAFQVPLSGGLLLIFIRKLNDPT